MASATRVTRKSNATTSEQAWPDISLEDRIRARIESRLGTRIRDLRVTVQRDQVEIAGRCATYYSKQLAQHAALGAIEDEKLYNAIQVGGDH